MDDHNQSQSSNYQIKGIKEGLLVTIGNGNWEDIIISLLNHIDRRIDFFNGAMLVVDVGSRVLHPLDLEELKMKLSSRGVGISSVLSESTSTVGAAKMLGLEKRIYQPGKKGELAPLNTQLDGENALLINRTLRSGNKIHFPGHVVVIGDVNPGSVIISNGSVVIWGKLRGSVHAGANGDSDAVICAIEIDKAIIRIANFTELIRSKKWKNMASVVRVENGILTLTNWN